MTRYTDEEKQTHISLWKESGLSKRAYSLESGILYKTFLNWLAVFAPDELTVRKKRVSKHSTSFIPISISSQENPNSVLGQAIEINYPNGIQVRCPMGMEVSFLKSLLQ